MLISVRPRRLGAATILRTVPRHLRTVTRFSHRPLQLVDRERLPQDNDVVVVKGGVTAGVHAVSGT